MKDRIPLKVLLSPLRMPFYRLKAFGIKRYHFFEADRIRFSCDWKRKDGSRIFPNYLEIDSKKVFDLVESNPELASKPDQFYVPWTECDLGELLPGEIEPEKMKIIETKKDTSQQELFK